MSLWCAKEQFSLILRLDGVQVFLHGYISRNPRTITKRQELLFVDVLILKVLNVKIEAGLHKRGKSAVLGINPVWLKSIYSISSIYSIYSIKVTIFFDNWKGLINNVILNILILWFNIILQIFNSRSTLIPTQFFLMKASLKYE